MDRKAIKVARKFLKKIKKDFSVDKFILFGSRARGDNFNTSDFDFVIVSPNFKDIPFIFRASEFYDYWDEDVDFEMLCYTEEEFERKKRQQGIVKKAVLEGISI